MKTTLFNRLTAGLLAAVLCLSVLAGCAAKPQKELTRYSTIFYDVFDTVTQVIAYCESEEEFTKQMEALHADLISYNQLYDIYNDYDGVVNVKTINDNAGKAPVQVDDRILSMLELARQMELLDKTFGVYGYGSIGRQTARIARAFGMKVLVCTRTVRPEYAEDGVEFVDVDTLLARSDVLSLHCPATPATRGLINAGALAKAKPGMILLNTARGALVDEEAVADALQSGQLAYYGADAFGTEPLPQDSRLRRLPNAILTPHIAWTTKEALQRLMDITTRNLRTWLEGSGEHIVNG